MKLIVGFVLLVLVTVTSIKAANNLIAVDHPVHFQPGIKGAVELTFQSQPSVYYQLEISSDLLEWDNEGYSVKGTGGQMTILASTRSLSAIFYRLRNNGDPANTAPLGPQGPVGPAGPPGLGLIERSISFNTTAALGEVLFVLNNSTVAHPPLPVEGGTYRVIVRNGTAAMPDGTTYSVPGTQIDWVWLGGIWQKHVNLLNDGSNISNSNEFLQNVGGLNYYGSTNISAWGDSLTAGAGGTPYPVYLRAILGRPIFNGGVGGETSTQIRTRMLPVVSRHEDFTIIWVGRNNFNDGVTVQSDVSSMVSALGHERYLVLSVLNASAEGSGSPNWARILALNSNLENIYGATHYRDIRTWLVNSALAVVGVTPTSQDLTDVANDVIPASLRSDSIHLNSTGYRAVAVYLSTRLPDSVRSTQWLGAAFASPGEIGGVNPPKITTSDLFIGNKRFAPAGNGDTQAWTNFLPATTATYALGSASQRWGTVFGTGGNFSSTGGGMAISLTTSPSASSGGVGIILSSAPAEKWRFGLRGMQNGVEGNDLLWGYFDGTNRNERLAMRADNGVRLNGVISVVTGTGSPEGIFTGRAGDLYLNSSGGGLATGFLKSAGNNTSTGWSPILTGPVLPATAGGAGTVNGLLKANGSGLVSAAVAGDDYVSPVNGKDIEITDATKGVIMRDTNGVRYRLTISTTGALVVTPL